MTMESIGIYEAKSKLSQLIEQAEAGHAVVITRHGKPVAKIVPARTRPQADRKAIMEEIRAFSKTVKLKKKLTMRELREAIEWGRR
jgi:prevent-host-death family protein